MSGNKKHMIPNQPRKNKHLSRSCSPTLPPFGTRKTRPTLLTLVIKWHYLRSLRWWYLRLQLRQTLHYLGQNGHRSSFIPVILPFSSQHHDLWRKSCFPPPHTLCWLNIIYIYAIICPLSSLFRGGISVVPVISPWHVQLPPDPLGSTTKDCKLCDRRKLPRRFLAKVAVGVASGNLLHSYWKWPIEIVSFPIKNGDFQ